MMAVYTIQRLGEQRRGLIIAKHFEVFDTVKVFRKDGSCKTGKIIYISEKIIMITGPYQPITEIKLDEIENVLYWEPPQDW